MYRGPNSALYGTDAGAAVIAINTPRGVTLKPVLNYTGDAGNLHTWRNEVTVGGAVQKLDYFGGFSRFDTSNAVARDRYHSATAVAECWLRHLSPIRSCGLRCAKWCVREWVAAGA